MQKQLSSISTGSFFCCSKIFLPVLFSFFTCIGFSQVKNSDSLSALLRTAKEDTNKVNLLWQLAYAININKPDKALILCQQANFLARKLKYAEGQSRSLGIMASTFMLMGNYPRALEFNLAKLKLEEKRNNPRNLASVLLNIGAVYASQEEFRKALIYYNKSYEVAASNNLNELNYHIMLNLGDAYDKLNIPDSAFLYFKKSLDIANELKDVDFIGTSMTGLGHTYRKLESNNLALEYYRKGLDYLKAANDDDVICEATLGMAKLFQDIGLADSATTYALHSYQLAEKDGFIARQLDASEFLAEHYKRVKNIDSSFAFLYHTQMLNDTINSKARIRESQILSSNEQIRQLEIEENKKIAVKERKIQLQLLFIGIFIPGFFLLTILLSRVKINIRVVKILGVLSLLILFEYLTLLLHPYVKEFTHHTPIYEMLIFVSIAAILIPTHHRIEHWLIKKLIARRAMAEEMKVKSKTLKIKTPKGI